VLIKDNQEVKHILILSSWYPNRTGPFLGNFIKDQTRLLAETYWVTVIYVTVDEVLTVSEVCDQTIGNLREIIVYIPKRSTFFLRKRETEKAFYNALRTVKKPDLIHAHCLLPKGYLFKKAKSFYNCPLIVTEHGSYFRKTHLAKWTLKERLIVSRSKKYIDQLIAVSEFQLNDLQSYFKDLNIKVIPNPISTNLFIPGPIPDDKPIRFLHVSTLDTELKNPMGIIEAVDLLCAKGYNQFHMTIISDEPYDLLKNKVAELKLDGFISFLGPLQHGELVAYYQNSHAFVLFSKYETFSVVIAEAWSCGVPVITTPVGIAAKMNANLGFTVKDDSPLSLAIEMEKILQGYKFDSQRIREYALKYSNEVVFEQLSNLYNQYFCVPN
jgi:glycosyltransferase involved in cell wall biosynthesis